MVKSTINIQQRNTILLLSMHYTKVINSWRGNKCQNLLNLFTVRIYSDMWQIFQNNILFKFQEFSYLHVNLLLTDSSRTLNALSLHFLGRPGTENPIFVFFSSALLSALWVDDTWILKLFWYNTVVSIFFSKIMHFKWISKFNHLNQKIFLSPKISLCSSVMLVFPKST